jgi:hypothetical protein
MEVLKLFVRAEFFMAALLLDGQEASSGDAITEAAGALDGGEVEENVGLQIAEQLRANTEWIVKSNQGNGVKVEIFCRLCVRIRQQAGFTRLS